uniref:Calmodulin-lysine N-methyltransferase n=1 Tax=Pseudo-nitzschia australis TaxID=44445 RepID=A0A7S4ASU2_9STRA
MSRSDENGKGRDKDEDPFWEIALNYDATSTGCRGENRQADSLDHDGDDSDDDSDCDCGSGDDSHHLRVQLGGKVTKYSLPNCGSAVLELARLSAEDGVWSPVGDHAWYSSALLTSLILRGEIVRDLVSMGTETFEEETNTDGGDDGYSYDHNSINDNDNNNYKTNKNNQSCGTKPFRVLELGSGAVGISGISFAVALSRQQTRFPSWTVTLTDNDESLLKQLEANVRSNVRSKNIVLSSSDGVGSPGGNDDCNCNHNDNESSTLSGNKSIQVEYLDWDLDGNDGDNKDGNGNDIGDTNLKQHKKRHQRIDPLLAADVVIGSELAYTHETATALVRILKALLDKNPTVQIWIVQVTDRYGWSEIVVPALELKENVEIESIPLGCDVHEMASTMIPMGGALDRFAFGAFRIRNTIRHVTLRNTDD